MSIVAVELPVSGDVGDSNSSQVRPKLLRRGTSQILSYYFQSADAPDLQRAYTESDADATDGERDGESETRLSRSSSPASSSSWDDGTFANIDAYGNSNGTGTKSIVPGVTASPAHPNESAAAVVHTVPLRRDSSAQSIYSSSSVEASSLPGRHQRRTSTRSTGASDKRRVAIMELEVDPAVLDALSDGHDREARDAARQTSRTDSSSSSSSYYAHARAPADSFSGHAPGASPASSLLSRRGIVGNFALVAPPDASPSAYTNLTPPFSASAVDRRSEAHQRARNESAGSSASASASSGRHHRSQSEAVTSSSSNSAWSGQRLRKGSRDIGIVGTSATPSPTTGQMKMDVTVDETKSSFDAAKAQVSPIFQTPSLSQTSFMPSDSSSLPADEPRSPSTTSNETKLHKQRPPNSYPFRSSRDENIGPVVVGVDPNQMWQAPSSVAYQNYSSSNDSLHSPLQSVSPPPAIPNAYLYYQPGIHAMAGPLPPPPRQIYPSPRNEPPPPRPPRLHTPASGSSALAKKLSDASIKPITGQSSPGITPSTTSSTLVSSQSEDSLKGSHTREGAFPINSVIVTDATPPRQAVKEPDQALKRKNTMDDLVKDLDNAIDEAAGLARSADTPPPSVPEPLRNATNREHTLKERRSALELKRDESRAGIELKREESRSTFKGEPLSRSSSSDYGDDDSDESKPLPDPLTHIPLVLAESYETDNKRSQSPHKIFDFAMKRFSSLPRTPSRLSVSKMSERSSLSQELAPHERASPRPKVIFFARIRSAWPDAMNFGDVMTKKSSTERSLCYANKINELANHDPGLGDWVIATKHNLTKSRNAPKPTPLSPIELKTPEVRSPTERAFVFQPRHASRASIGSEMTFPKRTDAYVATDLLYKPTEDLTLPKGPPSALPYPTLAQSPNVVPSRSLGLSAASSMRSIPSTLNSSKSTGGFFSSIGRKTSTKKDRAPTANAPPNKLLSKRQQTAPRTVEISATPSLPGGPRAPPGRMQRAQSVIAPKTPAPSFGHEHTESESEVTRRASSKRSPSVAPSIARSATVPVAHSTQDFDKQVAKLADLLPHADRGVLAGYLHRAGGQDILAIGRYLDDEKNNSLRRD